MKKMLLLAVAGVMAFASFASAANQEGQFSVSPVIGGYTYDGSQHLDTSLVYGIRGGYNFTKNIGVEALFDFVSTNHSTDTYRYGAELLYHFFPDKKFVPYIAAGLGSIYFDAKNTDRRSHLVLDYGVGAKYFLNDNIALRADIRGLTYRTGTYFGKDTNNNVEYTMGLYIPFGGVKPAAKPVVIPAPEVVEPAPAPVAPTAAIMVTPATVTRGQSATLNWSSVNATRCDIQPGIGNVQPQGSKIVTPADATEYTISCSGAGGTATSETRLNVIAPVVAPKKSVAAERFCKPTVLNIHFDTDKSNIKPQYEADLKTVGEFLKEFPNAKGEISGHTDNVASKAYNAKLSQARADSVRKYIVEKYKIANDRITAKGYGFSKPIASNKTKEGKAKNRRIEANFSCE